MTVEELKILLKVNGASTYKHEINEVTNVTNNYTNSIGSLTATISKLVSAGLMVKFSKQCVQAASDLEEVANVTNVTFGKTAAVVNDWAKTQAANYGLSETAAKRYIGTYGTMAKQFNMTTTQAATMGVELTKLTGDVASFYNLSDSAAATKLKAVFTGETEGLKELGVVMTETQLNAYAMSKGLGKTVKDMTEQEKVLLRYQFTLEKLSHAQGDFARTSDGYANSTRTLALNLENLKIEIGKELLPVAVQGITAINEGIQIIRPILVSAAKTVHYYAEAWQNVSTTTKTFLGVSVAAFAVLSVAPKIIGIIGTAIDILTVKTLTLTTVIKGLAGIVAVLFALAAMKEMKAQIEGLKSTEVEQGIDNIEALSDSLEDLGDSTKSLDTFLTSFDEVNKVGGGSSLMSNIVSTDDLANILAAANGLDDINGIVDSLNNSTEQLAAGDIFSADYWKKKAEDIKNELKTIGTIEKNLITGFFPPASIIFTSISLMIDKIKEKITGIFDDLAEVYNKAKAITSVGVGVGKAVIKSKTEKSGGLLGTVMKGLSKLPHYSGGGAPNKGSLFIAGETGPELVGSFGGSQTRVVNQSQMNGSGSQAPIYFQPTIQIDGRKLTAIVMDYANNMMRSGSTSPMIQLGG